jgi:hypothetical protein
MKIYTLVDIHRTEHTIDIDMTTSFQKNKLFYLNKSHAEDVRNKVEEDYGTTMKLVSFRIADHNWSTII